MKIAFSSLACPAWTLDEILAAAKRHGYNGVEWRGLGAEIDLRNAEAFQPANIAATKARFDAAGVPAVCLSSSVTVVAATVDDVTRQQHVAQAEAYIDMAKALGAPFVRVFCGNVPAGMPRDTALDRAADDLRRLGDFAAARGVMVVAETHDASTRTDDLMVLIRRANHPAVEVLWDIHHPYRAAGESIAHSLRTLDGHVRYTHLKDSAMNPDGSHTYVPIGQGDVPLREAIDGLRAQGYDGWLTLEWEKRWVPTLADAAEVLPHYITTLRGWL
jgi:sugar phosphate isomerase/epimerase